MIAPSNAGGLEIAPAGGATMKTTYFRFYLITR